MKKNFPLVLIMIAVAFSGIIYVGLFQTNTPYGEKIDRKLNVYYSKALQATGQHPKKKSLPRHGAKKFSNDTFKDRSFPLFTINNKGCMQHTFVKLTDYNTGKEYGKFFVRANKSFATRVDPGKYYIKVAQGDEWYGEKFLFGEDTFAWKVDTTIHFMKKTAEGQNSLNTPGVRFSKFEALPGSVLLRTHDRSKDDKIIVSRFMW